MPIPGAIRWSRAFRFRGDYSRTETDGVARLLALCYSDTDIDLVLAVLPDANTFFHDWSHVFACDADTLPPSGAFGGYITPPASWDTAIVPMAIGAGNR